jgi:hypothetical protein
MIRSLLRSTMVELDGLLQLRKIAIEIFKVCLHVADFGYIRGEPFCEVPNNIPIVLK